MKTAVILSGLGVIFALITGLLVLLNEDDRAFICGVISAIFEVIGVAMAIIHL